jgi:hypothetical protein
MTKDSPDVTGCSQKLAAIHPMRVVQAAEIEGAMNMKLRSGLSVCVGICALSMMVVPLAAGAYVQLGHLPSDKWLIDTRPKVAGDQGNLPPGGVPTGTHDPTPTPGNPGSPVNAVPEPGMLALVSLSLLAFGGASRARHRKV